MESMVIEATEQVTGDVLCASRVVHKGGQFNGKGIMTDQEEAASSKERLAAMQAAATSTK